MAKLGRGVGEEIWFFRADHAENTALTKAASSSPVDGDAVAGAVRNSNIATLKGVASYLFGLSGNRRQYTHVGAFKARIDSAGMSTYFHCGRGKCQWRLYCGRPSVCCTSPPDDMARVGIRVGAVQVQKPRGASRGDATPDDMCLDVATANQWLSKCAQPDQACLLTVPGNTDNFVVTDAIPSLPLDWAMAGDRVESIAKYFSSLCASKGCPQLP